MRSPIPLFIITFRLFFSHSLAHMFIVALFYFILYLKSFAVVAHWIDFVCRKQQLHHSRVSICALRKRKFNVTLVISILSLSIDVTVHHHQLQHRHHHHRRIEYVRKSTMDFKKSSNHSFKSVMLHGNSNRQWFCMHFDFLFFCICRISVWYVVHSKEHQI